VQKLGTVPAVRKAPALKTVSSRFESGGPATPDIGDYLGLTIETVSRTLTQLENDAAIELPTSRRVVLRNRNSLSRLNG
jgi:CRP-like cAMP-binding protein